MQQAPARSFPAPKRPTRNDWLLAAAAASVMLAAIVLFGDLRYDGNDDTCILRAFMGFTTPELPTFHLYMNALLVYPLNWLGTAFPGIAWFSYMQLAFLWLSCVVIGKTLLSLFARSGQPRWAGLAALAVFLAVFAMSYTCHVTYTITAGLLGAAGVAQILSVDCENGSSRQIVRGMAGALALVVLAYSLRQITVLPVLVFCGVALLYQGWISFGFGKRNKRDWKPLILTAVMVVSVMGALAGLRQLEIHLKDRQAYLDWQEARIEVMDYTGAKDLPQELLDQIGWTPAEAALVGQWYFLDANIDTAAFQAVADYENALHPITTAEKIQNGFRLIGAYFTESNIGGRSIWLFFAVVAFGLIMLLWKRTGALPALLMLLGTLVLSFVLVFYLSLQNRLPLRALLVVLLPAAAIAFAVLPACLPNLSHAKAAPRIACGVMVAGIAALSLWYLIPAIADITPEPINEGDESTLINAYADLDEYALENPDILLIYDNTFTADSRMFPATAGGVPTNVMFWGGWGSRSTEYEAQLAAFGFDAQQIDATIFFSENVRLACATLDPPPNSLFDYITDLYGDQFDYTFDGEWGGVHVLQFYTLK